MERGEREVEGKEKRYGRRGREELAVENRRDERKVRRWQGLWERENKKVCGQLIIGS